MNFENNSASSGYVTTETIYGTHEDSHVVMSEKVQSLAGSIYQEFERMIARYDEDVVKTLMPLLVNVLECLDSAYQSNQEHEVEVELLREDNEQLVTQYEREKAARKHAEQKLLEAEDQYEGERKELTGRLEALDSIVRMLELKHKNSLDHASRLEERENELKKEYAKLHDRYTELFKTHMDYMERTKLLLSTASERSEVRGRLGLNPVGRSSGPISFGFASLEGSVHVVEQTESIPGSPVSLSSSPSSPPIGSELAAVRTMERAHQTDPITQQSQATSPVAPPSGSVSKSQTKSEKRSGNTLYQELAFHDTDASMAEGDDGADITGSWVHPGEYASSVNDNYFGMGKEVENLILENNELLATKNALNVVKDDLIVKVDELTGEQEILREEVANLSAARETLRERVTMLEEELRHLKVVANNAGGGENEDEADVPMAQRRRFTRVEMARVLMERNQYKERFMELQDAVRWTEMVRASRVDSTMDKKNKQSIWKFFSNLFSTGERPQRPLSTPHLRAVAAPQPAMRHSRTQADFLETQLSDHHHRRHERSEQFRQVRAHVRKEDGRTHAYGWSLPGKSGQSQKGPSSCTSLSSGGVPVPVPVFCRPIAESEPRMTLLCAAGVNLNGGRTPDGGCMIGESVFYAKEEDNPRSLAYEMSKAAQTHSPEIEQIDRQLQSTQTVEHSEKNLSSLVWICSSTRSQGTVRVSIIDANNPAEVIESFPTIDKHILCVASVPGAEEEDYREHEERASMENEIKRHSQSLFCVGKSDSAESQSNGLPGSVGSNSGEATDKEVVVGATRLVQATILTPPSTPEKEPEPEEAEEPQGSPREDTDKGDVPAPESPPLSSTPVNQSDLNISSPEQAYDAFAQEVTSRNQDRERKMSTVMATMWLGTKSGNLYIHSAMANYRKCLARVKLNDAILSIVACSSRCIVALADGTVAIFARLADGQWDLSQYWLLALGDPRYSVRCLSAVGCTVWCGYRNKVHVIDPRSRTVLHSLEAHPRQESQVRQMACDGDGVWVSIKMDSTLRLYHAHTYQHLKDVDIEPYVSKMLGTGKLGFSLVRITALLISSGRLWIGTSNGVVISVPLSDSSSRDSVGGSLSSGGKVPGGAIPWCSMAHAQLSFHGHRDAVTFFVAVPGAGGSPARTPDSPRHHTPTQPPMLVISGGEGYIDFRIADSEMEDSVVVAEDGSSSGQSSLVERANKSHLIVWQVTPA
ncbi:JNK-interacting protein 3 isoform X2 [Pectinophora gossypiella]|uniref:JNK-interacting protein 3 isoform X2 n=1 Tax=Pectinophora gossypiella TaxID=13191 RepID=UPI00214ED5FA|nr:JNK-interacting protein 3 isoform X2 [Pectinophora gossypiella]